MSIRTKSKRQEIIEASAALFIEQGYERTTMSMIADRVGGSKATLYNHFRSKDDLLRAVVKYDVTEGAYRLLDEFPAGDELCDGLAHLGAQYLRRRLAALPMSNLRTLANQPADSAIRTEFYASTLRPAWERLAERFAKLMDENRLRRADPWVAAMHWKGLNEGELLERRLLGASVPGRDEIEKLAMLAADAFLRIYGLPRTPDGDDLTDGNPAPAEPSCHVGAVHGHHNR